MRWTNRMAAGPDADAAMTPPPPAETDEARRPLSLERAKASLLDGRRAWRTGRHRRAAAVGGAAVGALAVGAEAVGAQAVGAQAVGARATGALAIGSLAFGALALGAVAVGAFAIGRLSVGQARIGTADIGRLRIGRLEVESFLTPAAMHERRRPRSGLEA